MTRPDLSPKTCKYGETGRRDRWYVQPLLVVLVLTAFICYSTWAAFQGEHYFLGHYLSPFYSPELFGPSLHSWFGPQPLWWPLWLPFSPAFLILWIPVGIRFTCYYYRGAYYKAFWLDPHACAVGEPRNQYLGEQSWPLVMQNIHRYFIYLGVGLVAILSLDAWKAFWFVDPATGKEAFGIGVGTLVLLANAIFLGSYTFGCHSLRHLVGGFMDRLSNAPARAAALQCVCQLNSRHQLFAWISLGWVAFTDLYIRLCSMGIWTDWRIL